MPDPKAIAALELVKVMSHESVGRGTTYIITVPGSGMCKIGFTNHGDAKGRVAELQKACPFDFTVLKETRGGKELEQALHHLFTEQRYRNEWFRIEGPLKDFLDELQGVN